MLHLLEVSPEYFVFSCISFGFTFGYGVVGAWRLVGGVVYGIVSCGRFTFLRFRWGLLVWLVYSGHLRLYVGCL